MSPTQATQTEGTFTQSYYSPESNPVHAPGAAAKSPVHSYANNPGSYGQPFQPYQAYQQPYQHVVPEGPPVHKAWEMTKMVLHGASILFGFIALGTALSVRDSWIGRSFTVFSVPMAIVCILWSSAELLVRYFRGGKGMPPGAHVAICLLFWLALAFVSAIEIGSLLLHSNWDEQDEDSVQCWDDDRPGRDKFGKCDPERFFDGRKSVAAAACAFTTLLFVAYFILFVGACVDTSRRRAARRVPVVVMAGPQYYQGAQMQQDRGQAPQEHNRGDARADPEAAIPLQTTTSPSPPAPAAPAQVTEYYTPTGGYRP
ncbi:hypothetical protein HJFPF1_11955 [Paramyrothecium foliicola]|nr:hypothetical protein HJFPF1_11955 [Paramyrothecium foliicola]